jgi:hypothetical protein
MEPAFTRCGLLSVFYPVNYIMTIQAPADSSANLIDRLVYELYGLTEEEIRIVEEGTAK